MVLGILLCLASFTQYYNFDIHVSSFLLEKIAIVISSFILLSIILLYEYTTFYYPSYCWKTFEWFSGFDFFHIKLLGAFFAFWRIHRWPYLCWLNSLEGNDFVKSIEGTTLIQVKSFPKCWIFFTLSSVVYKISSCLSSSLTFGVISLLNFSHF